MRMRTPAALLVLGILTSACANASTEPGDGGSTSPGNVDRPTGPMDLILRVSSEGGFVPAEYTLTATPAFSLFGDGTVVVPGAQIDIYPAPALPPLVATTVTSEGVDALVQAAVDARLDEDHEYTDLGSVGVADATTTVFTFTVDGVAHVTKVYALGILSGERPDGMSDEEYAARTRLERFQASLQDLRGTLPDGAVGRETAFTPAGMRLFVSEYRPADDLKQPAVGWPLATPLSTLGEPAALDGYRCATVAGAELDAVLPLAEGANQLTPWRSGGDRYAIVFRPLLPDETAC